MRILSRLHRTPPAGPLRAADGVFPILASACYLLLSALWIGYSDSVGALLFSSPDELTRFQSLKGLGFVAVSALAIYLLLCSRGAGPGPERAWHLPRPLTLSIGALLALLVLAVAVPLVGIAAWGMHRDSERHMSEARRLVGDLAQVSAAATDQFVAGHVRLARLLASRNELRALDASRCDNLIGSIVGARSTVLEIFTTDPQGRVVCASRPAPEPLRVTPLALRQLDGLERSGLAIGPPERLSPGGDWVISIAAVLRGPQQEATGAVQLVLQLDAFRPIMSQLLPHGGIAGILDADGHVIARSAAERDYLGHRAGSPLVQQFASRRAGETTGVGPDGVERLYGYRPIGQTGWVAVTGVPTSSLYAATRDSALRFSLGALAVVAVAAWLALRIGRRISGPIHALTEAAGRVTAGRLDERALEDGPREVARVAASFNRMVDRTQEVLHALGESEARHRSLVQMAPDGIVVHENGRIGFANPRFASIFGLAPDQRIDSDEALVALASPECRPALAQRLARLREQPGETDALALRMLRPDGNVVELEHSCSSVRQNGRVVVQSHFLDVTARNRALAELEHSHGTLERRIADRTQELNAANQALESFSYSVAHDLRSPVGRVGGFADVLSQEAGRGNYAKVAHYAERILHNTRMMAGMIDGLLQVSGADRAPLHCKPVDMAALVAQVLDELSARDLATVQVGPMPQVVADVQTLHQVWLNLVSNALKYSALTPGPHITLGCESRESELLFTVSDNGTGFDAVEAARLFTPFQRLSTSTGFEGSGVGLAIVRRIVERHGGRVWADGTPGQGATFGFSLPRVQPVHEPLPEEPALRAARTPNLRRVK
jgi:PAS domain S-box-containing protein